MSHVPTGTRAKSYGAFYTDVAVADFLVAWALRSPADTVLDPSFGGGVFLEAAAKRLADLGGCAAQVHGVELDPEVHARVSDELCAARGLCDKHLLRSDFFEIAPDRFGPYDAVVGNPPFIRFQRFRGATRATALARARAQGVALSNLASSWAAFLVHSAALLKPGGRLAMVVPAEVGHAAYARPVLDYLIRSFGRVTLLTFKERLFPELDQSTLLLFAEGKDAPPTGLFWRDLAGPAELLRDGNALLANVTALDARALTEGRERLAVRLIPPKARELYRTLTQETVTRSLGELATVAIGYVTGANGFFHLAPDQAEAWSIPEAFLQPAVFRGKAFAGLTFTVEDWYQAARNSVAGYLLKVDTLDVPATVQRYLDHGEAEGVPQAFKCRERTPWFRVPNVYSPEAFLTSMSGRWPGLVANLAGVAAPNSLHTVRLHPGATLTGLELSALWQTSLTTLSVELEGHALGGGMLKLEPSEARRVVVAYPEQHGWLAQLAHDLDALVRRGDDEAAWQQADRVILQGLLGLSEADCRLLRQAADSLHERRYYHRHGNRAR